jgi:surface protein
MFSRCGSLRIIDASSFRTPKVQNLVDIFAYCKQLIPVNVSNFDTSNVVLFQGMFYACDNLRFVD